MFQYNKVSICWQVVHDMNTGMIEIQTVQYPDKISIYKYMNACKIINRFLNTSVENPLI